MAKDLKNAALEAFKRSARGPETEPDEEDGGPAEQAEPTPSPERGRKPLRSTTGGTRRGPRSGKSGGPNAVGTATVTRRKAPAAAAAAVQAAQTRRPGALGKRGKTGAPAAEKGGGGGRGLLWSLILINLVLMVLVIVLLVRTAGLERLAADHGKLLQEQAKALQTIAESADKARRNAQAKFGVFRDEKKKLHGVFVNYEKPSRYRVIELSSKDAD